MKPAGQPHLPSAGRSHPGLQRPNNEDRWALRAYQARAEDDSQPVLLAVLCDGVGGHLAGEVAAEMAVEHICSTAELSDGLDPQRILQDAMLQASQNIVKQSERTLHQTGMACTCVCAWIAGNRLYTASVGDSRIYLLHGLRFRQISIDHTWVQEAVEQGLLRPEQARRHPNAHAIRRCLGSAAPPEIDFRLRLSRHESDQQALGNQGLRLSAGDVVLLCSDGLSDLVENQELRAVLQAHPLEAALDELVHLALARGGHDNITLIGISVPKSTSSRQRRWNLPVFRHPSADA